MPNPNPQQEPQPTPSSSDTETTVTTDPLTPTATNTNPRLSKTSSINLATTSLDLVSQATSPGLSAQQAASHRDRIVAFISLHAQRHPPPPRYIVSALRQTLDHPDTKHVNNALTLLDELMRLVPQFFRYVANDRFYRRLLAFVDIEPAGVTRVFKRVKAVKAVEQGVCERVKILLRAWAEELAHMFRGVYDASAAFLILRYNDLRKKTTFPAVPKSSSPWICNVQAGEGETNAGVVPVQKKKEETIAWAEVENTVGLFVEFVSSVGNVEELRGEVCAQIAVRCEVIMDKLERKCVQIDDVQVERRVAVNEMLRKWMGVYKKSLERGRMVREDGGSAAGDGIRMDEDAIT